MTVLRAATMRRAMFLLVFTGACSSSTNGTAGDAATDALRIDVVSADVVSADVVSADVVSADVVSADVVSDRASVDATTDVARDAAPMRCASNRDCPAGTVCEFLEGCAQTTGTCEDDGCQKLPVAPQYCGCDGRTIQQVSACLPDRAWRAMGACPDAGVSDGGVSDGGVSDGAVRDAGASDGAVVDAGAAMLWQSPGGFAGWGPAVLVRGDGAVSFWRMRSGFSLATVDAVAPDRTERVSVDEAAMLFALWSAVDTSGLPHRPSTTIDCYPSVTVRRCATCAEARLAYTTPMSLLPEMDAVWAWFDARFAADSPRGHCAF